MKREDFLYALNSIKGQKLRTSITISIIAVGILSLLGALSATSALNSRLNDNFGRLGVNTLFISNKKGESYPVITHTQVKEFSAYFSDLSSGKLVNIYPYITVDVELDGIRCGDKSSTPDVDVIGGDGGFVELNGAVVSKGRKFSYTEETNGSAVALVGANISKMVLPQGEEVGEKINICGRKFQVIGIFAPMGSGPGSLDNVVVIPIESAKNGLLKGGESFVLALSGEGDLRSIKEDIYLAIRSARRLDYTDEDDFDIVYRESLYSQMNEIIGMVTLAAFLIGFITLIGASVGLMNIMLVSVRERRGEIGIRKALGATNQDIKNLFLLEALLMGEIGGLIGAVLGLLVGWIISLSMEVDFVIPWGWIIVSQVVSISVSLLSGMIPAKKGASLTPTEALASS